MASKTALLVLLNIMFFTMVSSNNVPCGCSTPKTPKTPKPPSTPKTPTPSTPKTPTIPKTPTPKTPTPSTPKTPTIPKTPTPSTPKSPSTPKTPPSGGKCPIDTLKLGVCANLLSGLVNVVVGTPPKTSCCSLINGLANLDAAVCLCTAIKANVLGINLNVPVSLSLLLNYCGKKAPSGFQCA